MNITQRKSPSFGLIEILLVVVLIGTKIAAFSTSSYHPKWKSIGNTASNRILFSFALKSKSRGKFNPFGEMMSNLFDAATSSVDIEEVNDKLEADLLTCDVPNWDEIRGILESKQTAGEKSFRDNLKTGIGEGSPLHTLRLFDKSNKEEDIRVVFYRDSASWCPYCQKVWMSLEEKRIPYKIGKLILKDFKSF